MGKMHKALMLLLIAAVLLIMLVLDLNLPAGVIHGIPYVVLISVSYWLPWRRAPVVLAAVGTLLIVVGYLYSAERVDTTALLLNVSLEAAVLWVTAFLVLRYRASSRSLEDREQRLRASGGDCSRRGHDHRCQRHRAGIQSGLRTVVRIPGRRGYWQERQDADAASLSGGTR